MRERASPLLLLPLVALLVVLAIAVYQRLDPTIGFDYGGHLDYARYVDATASIPLADRGWQMYHPPAFYVLTVLIFEALHRLGAGLTLTDAGRALATVAWVAEGAVAIVLVRVLGGSWLGACATAALVWLLPGQAMMGSMLYNETLTGAGVAILILGIALFGRRSRTALVLVGVGFGLAVLSKYSGLVAAIAAFPFLLWVARHRLRSLAIALLPGSLIGAWFYGRNVLHFGTPLPLNSDLFLLKSWDPVGFGDPPGFFTRLALGPCAVHRSFWGGLWKWFWATDCSGIAPWRQVVGGALLVGAGVATVAVLAALGWTVLRKAEWEPARLVLVAVPIAIFAAFLYYNLRQPALTSDKGVYVLAGLVPAAVATGLELSRLTARHEAGVIAYLGILGWSLLMVHASGFA
jgi:hypothetical protein